MCTPRPTTFQQALVLAGKKYSKVGVVKYWHTYTGCPEHEATFGFDTALSLAEIEHAHNLTLPGCIEMLRNIPCDSNAEVDAAIKTLSDHALVVTNDTPKHIVQMGQDLARLYNNTCQLDNGAIIRITSNKKAHFCVILQSMFIVSETDRRK